MEIVIKNGEDETVYQNVDGYYLAVQQLTPLSNSDGDMAMERRMKSYSVGEARELIKEMRQSIHELQRHMDGTS